MLEELREAASEPHPLPMLQLASSILSSLNTQTDNPFQQADQPDQDAPDQASFIRALHEAGLPETDLLLAAICGMVGDELERARIRRTLLSHDPDASSLLKRFVSPAPYRAVEMTHLLGDGDNLFLGTRTPAGEECTFVIYVDHNLGTLVKDAFALPGPLDDVVTTMQRKAAGADVEWAGLDLADARARTEEAIELAGMTYPPLESETWPAVRPLVEAVLRAAPAGGTGYQRPEYSETQLNELTEDFFSSEHGRHLDDGDHRPMLETLLWFGTDYGPGEPLRWSPTAVEILLLDWVPRKIMAPVDELKLIPALLRAFVRYSHARRSVPAHLTEDTLAAIDSMEPDYVQSISSERRQGPEALLESAGALPPLAGDATLEQRQAAIQGRLDELLELESSGIEEIMLAAIRRQVGGGEEMDRLDDRPLPDEKFNWDALPTDIHQRVREVLDLAEKCCADLLDGGTSGSARPVPEHRTAVRRLLARAAAGDPAIFRRKGAAETAAAALCWIIAKANGTLQSYSGGLTAKKLAAHFGFKAVPSQRAQVLLRGAGINDHQDGSMDLGTPDLLTSASRGDLIEMRDKYRAAQQG